MKQAPSFIEEKRLHAQGYKIIAGIDEAGRGPLAGPVVAAAVILPVDRPLSWLRLVRDSKLLTPRKRECIFNCMQQDGISFGVGIVPHETIDEHGIVAATQQAMLSAIEQLSTRPDFLLIDYVKLHNITLPQKSIIKGDNLSLSIAGASIMAKVTRDRLMVELDRKYPGYGFSQNKGYGTSKHLEILRCNGPCSIHRKSFAPVRWLRNTY